MANNKGKLLIIGFGPGHFDHMTERARQAIAESDVIIGYNTYVDLIREQISTQKVVRTGMTEEVSRAQEAVRQAELGLKVAVISSGDAGVYGMAGLVYEVLIEQGWQVESGVEVEVIPGVSAINSCASLLGSPIMHDACTISLSDHLTPWNTIARRIEAAASADFVIALYNPRSGRRTRQIIETQRILLEHRSPDTPVGLVKSAYRKREHVILTQLDRMLEHDIGMLTTVIIGNSTTFVYDGLMVTPRGYQRKYTLDGMEQKLKPHQRLKPEAEPWSLAASQSISEDQKENRKEERVDENPSSTGEGQSSAHARSTAYSISSAVAPQALATEALSLLQRKGMIMTTALEKESVGVERVVSIFEVAVSTGLAEKRWTPGQMKTVAEIAGDEGVIEYSQHHRLMLRIPTDQPDAIVAQLERDGFLVEPVGNTVQVKACDFCHGDKGESIPYVEELHRRIGGLAVPKELKVGFNGCAMACYGAATEEIGIVFRRGTCDLFLGGKNIGRNAHSAERVAEGMEPEAMLDAVEKIVMEYKEKANANERFNKFFKRVPEVAGFRSSEAPQPKIPELACGEQ
ncbi:precorrin-3B C(17)-methyltransferase [Marininema halotolerans]|uniref:Precorrin-3B C17-methyltransferase n=1 Tax=Marininema halotolerans TaxID=1155944 RepID=A0A1I6QLI9_9BACL|nr:precorrin-3B C(17)-methyltransferase [Marininema halotolerans]SFS53293.1 precorrin-3B C17-methyltransferase [Marininema halotolerans]